MEKKRLEFLKLFKEYKNQRAKKRRREEIENNEYFFFRLQFCKSDKSWVDFKHKFIHIDLDEENLSYFKKKYNIEVVSELKDNIKSLKEEYKDFCED